MCIFNIGLTYGLSKLGGSAGGLVPVAFMEVAGFAAWCRPIWLSSGSGPAPRKPFEL